MLIPNLFVNTINQLAYGKFAEELSKELSEVVTACSDTGKAGELTVTIKVSPDANGRYKFIHQCKTKKPTGPVYGTILWGTPEGNLQKTDPAQTELPLRDVSEKTEVREIAAAVTTVKSIG